LVLIGYYNISLSADQLSPRAMITIPSKKTAGAYKRIGLIIPYIGSESEKWLNQCFQGEVKQQIKIV
jgi:hypothetical protein